MNEYPYQFFFEPQQSWSAAAPLLLSLALVIAGLIGLAYVIQWSRGIGGRAQDLERFNALASHFGLNRKETMILLNMARQAGVREKSRVLTNAESFEKMVSATEAQGFLGKRFIRKNQHLLSYARLKLFGRDIGPADKVENTQGLRAGLRLLIRYTDYAGAEVWGHLVDVDNEGLVVVIPNDRGISIPLRKETLLEVTAYIPRHDPVTFQTVVKSVVPGPRRMVVLDHAKRVSVKNLNSPSLRDHFAPMGLHNRPAHTHS